MNKERKLSKEGVDFQKKVRAALKYIVDRMSAEEKMVLYCNRGNWASHFIDNGVLQMVIKKEDVD